MKRLFPEAEIYSEEFLGLTKSITAYGGFHAEGFNSGNQHELVI
jgi:hypothetical protein